MAKPFIDYMAKVPKDLAEKTTQAISHAVEAIHSGSKGDIEAAAKELSEIQLDTFHKTWDALHDELNEHLLSCYPDSWEVRGRLRDGFIKVLRKAERIRKMRLGRLWLITIATIAAVIGAISYVVLPTSNSGTVGTTHVQQSEGDMTSPKAETHLSTDQPPTEEANPVRTESPSDTPRVSTPTPSRNKQSRDCYYAANLDYQHPGPGTWICSAPKVQEHQQVAVPVYQYTSPTTPVPVAPSPSEDKPHRSEPSESSSGCGPPPPNPIYACSQRSSECSRQIQEYSSWCRCNGFTGGLNTSTGACEY